MAYKGLSLFFAIAIVPTRVTHATQPQRGDATQNAVVRLA